MRTLGEKLIDWLQAYDVDTVFGIPGVHTVELYRGLADSLIHHVTPRHEQGAGFMADGYARVTGKPGVAFVITGPGLTNILTPMAQAYADSIAMLVISSVNANPSLGLGAGDLHEVRNQSLMAAQAAAFSHTVTHPDQLPGVLARAWAVFEGARPRPVHIQIPLDLLSRPVGDGPVLRRVPVCPAEPSESVISKVSERLVQAKSPLILAGGGARWAASEIAELASRRLGAPVVMTTNARGVLAPESPLAVSASPSLVCIRDAIAEADLVLAIGTEIGRTDYDMYDRAPVEVPGVLIRVDIDAEQFARGPAADLAILADAGRFCAALSARMSDAGLRADGAARAATMRKAAFAEIGDKYRKIVGFLNQIRDALPGAPIVGDSTQGTYAGNLYFEASAPGRWFGAATGYGALGYGLPAAIGAAHGLRTPVVCLAGDGGVQFTLTELGTAVEEKLPLILLVWNNQGYGEIKDYMVGRQIKPVGVDLHTPDFAAIARAYGAAGERLMAGDALPGLLRAAAARSGPTVIEIDEALILG